MNLKTTTITDQRRAHSTATTPTHDVATCNGCDTVLHIADIAYWLHESVHTLYKYSAIGYPAFPKRLHLRNGRVATTCKFTKAWLEEVSS